VSFEQQEMVARFSQLNLIQRNFIQLNFVLKSQHPYVTADKPAMTADSLLSNVGGSLSLWLGMTVMFAFEVIEFVYTIVSIRHSGKKSSKTNGQLPTLDECQVTKL
jgi:hypothetical protein